MILRIATRFVLPQSLKHLKSALSGYFLMFCGFQGHAFSCEHEKHDFGTLYHQYILNMILIKDIVNKTAHSKKMLSII